jgi:predicted nucleotidyltransferase
MLFDQHRLREHIERYITYIRQEFNVQKAILYGSYVYGTPREDSDIDLLVLSEDFARMASATPPEVGMAGLAGRDRLYSAYWVHLGRV